MPEHQNITDTIAALATPFGRGGIGIIRISGPMAEGIIRKIFQPRSPVASFESHRLYLGQLIDPERGQMIDEILLSYMKAPHSYTCEDVDEINSHSGHVVLSKILELILNQGARLAKPGEFSFRAFKNGRIDLTQAEAIVDLVNSRSERGLVMASRQIRGDLGTEVEKLRQCVIDIIAQVEVAIDFPEEESEILNSEETASRIKELLIYPIEKIIAAYERRKIWMEGITTVITGKVNSGKSSILNRLLNEQRAIVTPIPGTTRDVIEATIDIEGIPLRLMDTAGIREVADEVERIGISLTQQKFAEADLRLVIIDQSRKLTRDDLDLIEKSQGMMSLVILNKMDLKSGIDEKQLKKSLNTLPCVKISALTGEGIDFLCKTIKDLIMDGGEDMSSSSPAPNIRQKAALEEASNFFKNAARSTKINLPAELIAADLGSGLQALGEITGETTNEEIYDRIFSEFCLGK